MSSRHHLHPHGGQSREGHQSHGRGHEDPTFNCVQVDWRCKKGEPRSRRDTILADTNLEERHFRLRYEMGLAMMNSTALENLIFFSDEKIFLLQKGLIDV